MSIRSWGAFELKGADISWQDLGELAFKVTEIATRNRVGIALGSHVRPDYRNEFKGMPNRVPFELLDDPRMDVAETLFGGDGIKQYLGHERVDTGESLASRMHRVQSFLEEMLSTDIVKRIILHVYGEVNDECTLEIKAKDYQTTMLDLYKKKDNWAPTVKFIISK